MLANDILSEEGGGTTFLLLHATAREKGRKTDSNFVDTLIVHFTVVCLVAKPLNGSDA